MELRPDASKGKKNLLYGDMSMLNLTKRMTRQILHQSRNFRRPTVLRTQLEMRTTGPHMTNSHADLGLIIGLRFRGSQYPVQCGAAVNMCNSAWTYICTILNG
jgi:hypothetical protein